MGVSLLKLPKALTPCFGARVITSYPDLSRIYVTALAAYIVTVWIGSVVLPAQPVSSENDTNQLGNLDLPKELLHLASAALY